MARWSDVEATVPELAARARNLFDANRHKTMATIRADGSPRISGIELEFRLGDVWVGSMPDARKARDLQCDGRVAIHNASIDPGADGADWPGDAKLSGRAHEVYDEAVIAQWLGLSEQAPPSPFHLFRIDVQELVVTALSDTRDKLVVEWWTQARGPGRAER